MIWYAYIEYAFVECPYIGFIYDCKVEFQAPVLKSSYVAPRAVVSMHEAEGSQSVPGLCLLGGCE